MQEIVVRVGGQEGEVVHLASCGSSAWCVNLLPSTLSCFGQEMNVLRSVTSVDVPFSPPNHPTPSSSIFQAATTRICQTDRALLLTAVSWASLPKKVAMAALDRVSSTSVVTTTMANWVRGGVLGDSHDDAVDVAGAMFVGRPRLSSRGSVEASAWPKVLPLVAFERTRRSEGDAGCLVVDLAFGGIMNEMWREFKSLSCSSYT